MRKAVVAISALVMSLATPALAHRLDEYLQATTISPGRDRVGVEIRLVPGVDVFRTLVASMDADGDGTISEAEQRAYAALVLRDVSLTVDGDREQLRLVSATFPRVELMKEGLGGIVLRFVADVAPGGPNRKLAFENHHQAKISAYLVNGLVPSDPGISITSQSRNYEQTVYQLDYAQAPSGKSLARAACPVRANLGWVGALAATGLWAGSRRARR